MIPPDFADIIHTECLSTKAAAYRFGVTPLLIRRAQNRAGFAFKSIRNTQIVAMIGQGVVTSAALAERFRCSRNCMSVTLGVLADCGLIVRDGHVSSPVGPPFVRWRVAGDRA